MKSDFSIKKISLVFAAVAIALSAVFFSVPTMIRHFDGATAVDLQLDEQEATIRSIKAVMPAVVTITVYGKEEFVALDAATGEQVKSEERIRKGTGSGFLITSDGLIMTNKHLISVEDENKAEYRVALSEGKEYYAQFIGKDPVNDLAILKIFDKNLPYVQLGDSSKLNIGTTVIAIGNALGRYQNSATKGIVSGLGRSIEASDQLGSSEVLDNVIQTDAEINPGNSGGPLIDLNGKVVGISVAVDLEGTAIGFAIPINDARVVINSVKTSGRIIRAFLGVRYQMLTPEIAGQNDLARTSGAWLIKGEDGSPAIVPGSPAEQAGIQEGDIVYEVDGVKVEGANTLMSFIQKRKPGDKIGFKILRGDSIIVRIAQLSEFK